MAPIRTVLLASPRSFCAGVDRAIETVERVLDDSSAGGIRSGPVYVRKQIVHNTHVVAELESKGAIFVEEVGDVPEGSTVVFAAHGVSPQVWREAVERRLTVVDATCPLVAKVHAEARRFAAQGTVVIIGHADHEETQGTFGEAPDRMVIVETLDDVATLVLPDPAGISYLTQTTLAVDETAQIIAALRARFPEIRGPSSDDICYATTNRQEALAAITDEADVVFVVGSANSSNSVRLTELSRRRGTPAHLIEDAGDLQAGWIEGTTVIGLTAGASAPPSLVAEVIAALRTYGPLVVEEREITRETIQFLPPL